VTYETGLDLTEPSSSWSRIADLPWRRPSVIERIELGCGGYVTNRSYCDPGTLLRDPDALARWQNGLDEAGLVVSGLAVHGAPLSPNRTLAAEHTMDSRRACELAALSGTRRITLLAGLPEARAGDSTPCWIVTADPEENVDLLEATAPGTPGRRAWNFRTVGGA